MIAGNDEAGKTTVADYIKELHHAIDLRAHRVSFSDAPKDDLGELGIDMFTKPFSQTKRELIRSYAECAKEQFGDNYWANRLITYVGSRYDNTSTTYIVDDLRFNIELSTWRVQYPDSKIIVLTNNIPTYSYTSHESVIQVNDIIHLARTNKIPNVLCINNMHTINGIHLSVKEMIEDYLFEIPID